VAGEGASPVPHNPACVVNAAAYVDGRRVADVSLEQVSDLLKRPGHFVWIGLHEPDEAVLRDLQEEFGLHDLAIEDALRAHQRPKVEEYGDSLFIVLRTARCAENAGDSRDPVQVEFGETHIFVGAHYLVSVRHGASLSYAEVRTRVENAPQLLRKGPGFVLYAILDFVVDHYFPIIETLEDSVEQLEESIFSGEFDRAVSERIYTLKSELLRFKRAVSPLIEVCNRLVRFDLGWIARDTRLYFRDVYDHVLRINEAIDNQRELLTSALEASFSLMSVRQNETMKKLAAWAAIIGVPTMIAGIYGMNFKSMPELDWRFGYPAALGSMGAACGVLYWRFKREGWL
jgi:magnesium transporter